MPGPFPSDGRRPVRAGILAIAAFAVVACDLVSHTAPSFGQETAEAANEPASAEPVVLAGDRVRYWDEGPVRWVWAEGRSAALQLTEGLRARSLLVRVECRGNGDDAVYQIEAFGEGEAHATGDTGGASRTARIRLVTRGEVQLKAHAAGGLSHLDKAPSVLPIRDRGFPAQRPERAEPRPDPPPTAMEPPRPLTVPESAASLPPRDSEITLAQFQEEGFPTPPQELLQDTRPEPAGEPIPEAFEDQVDLSPDPLGNLLPNEEDLVPPSEMPLPPVEDRGPAPILPNTRRIVSINPRDSGPNFTSEVRMAQDGSGKVTILIRGGVNIVAESPGRGVVDISADSAVIWTQLGDGAGGPAPGAVERLDQDPGQPLEAYLEGNVVFRQDRRQVAGNGDQVVVLAKQFYIDLLHDRFIAQEGEVNIFDAALIGPVKAISREIRRYRPLVGRIGEVPILGADQIRAEDALLTGSRFPVPGYRFQARTVDLTQLDVPVVDPNTGKPIGDPKDPASPEAQRWRIEARQNVFKLGRVPIFYWPRIVTDSDDLDPPLRQIQLRYNNYFGYQVLTDWSTFKIFGVRRPNHIDNWNLDIDYLSERGPAMGSEIGWSGRDVFGDFLDPYHRNKGREGIDRPYFGYLDFWGVLEHRVDNLGPGPAVVTYGPPGAGKAGFQRTSVPSFEDFRGRFLFRDMQSLLSSDAPVDEDFRIQLEAALESDRNFLEQYYLRLFTTGLDQSTLAYGIYQDRNYALTLLAEANMMNWQTETQWFPKADFYWLGQPVLGLFTYSQNTGADYANTHTDVMVNNPNIFAFQPFDPVSATSGAFRTGRLWTNHELAMPLHLGVFRVVPYLQGQLVGWDNQYQDSLPWLELADVLPDQAFIRGPQGAKLGRAWGAAGARANVMAWKIYPTYESELFNVHGLAHKINFDVDYRTAYSNVDLNRIGVQDDLDDNPYEYTRRYFALVNYVSGILPAQYDPRFLTLRRTISPITGTTDIQDDMETVQFALRQRLQTKRGPEGRRRVIDYMMLDLTTTYFPQPSRDNFGKPWGQSMYNFEWYMGDRTSLASYGWFEFFDITGEPILLSNPRRANDPFGLKVITTGVNISRPPRGMVFVGYSVINSGPIFTSALNVAASYWISPKWYSSFGTSYDFGNAILLGSTVGFTRIGADWLTSFGLSVDPQRDSYNVGFELTPRLSPNLRLGAGAGVARFDSRYAPTQ